MKFAPLLLVLLALQFLPGLGVGEAEAACTGTLSLRADCDSKAEAYQFVQTLLQPQASVSCVGTWGYGSRIAINDDPADRVTGYLMCKNASGSESLGYGKDVYHPTANGGCPAGTTWDDVGKTCFSSAACLAKPPLGSTRVESASPWSSVCSGGCAYEQDDAVSVQMLDDSTGKWVGFTTGWKPSGDACTTSTPSASAFSDPQACQPAPDGQTFCIKPTGEHCYSLTNGSGRQICWRAGETGEKTDGTALQVRNGGSAAATPQTPPPAGDTFTQSGGSVTKTSSFNGTTITTTTTNYVTGSGTNAGGEDSGEPGDGSGSPSGGSGDAPEFDEPSVPEAPGVPWGVLPGQSDWSANLGGSSACPAPVVVNVGIGDVTTDLAFEFQPLCDLADRVYWLLVGLGLMIGAYIVAGVRR